MRNTVALRAVVCCCTYKLLYFCVSYTAALQCEKYGKIRYGTTLFSGVFSRRTALANCRRGIRPRDYEKGLIMYHRGNFCVYWRFCRCSYGWSLHRAARAPSWLFRPLFAHCHRKFVFAPISRQQCENEPMINRSGDTEVADSASETDFFFFARYCVF